MNALDHESPDSYDRVRIQTREGMLALGRAFIAAGVPSLVASLWVVPDVGASPLIEGFNGVLAAGSSKLEALQAAKRATRSTRIAVAGGRVVSLSHLLFRAPFVLVGDPD